MDHRETTLPAGAMLKILRELKNREKDRVRLLGDCVRCESPSHNKAAVDRFAAIVAREWRRRGAKVRILRNSSRGNHVRAEVWLRPGRPARHSGENAVSRFWRPGLGTRNIRYEGRARFSPFRHGCAEGDRNQTQQAPRVSVELR